MIIYHSRGAYPARLAAAIHAGLLPSDPPSDLAAAVRLLGGSEALQAEGLWAAGIDARGRRVYALGRASRPDVVERAFHSLAALADIPRGCFALAAVGRPVAWDDLRVRALRMLGLARAADRALLRGLHRAWGEAARVAGAAHPWTPAAPAEAGSGSGRHERNLIYFCYGGSHSSITASNIHLGRLPGRRRAGWGQILHQPHFDKAGKNELGLIRHMGDDEAGNAVHVVGLAGGKAVVSRALADLLALCGLPVANFRFEPTLQNSGLILRLGGYISRGLGWVALGRPLCVLGVWLKYPLYAAHVAEVRRKLGLTVHAASDIID